MFDPNVHATVTATMRAIQRYVAYGFLFYVTGEVAADRAPALFRKLHERFNLTMTDSQRRHARKRGEAVFRLVLWPLTGTTTFRWWLLRTEGEHPLLSLETWRDARRERIQWPWVFELAQMPVPPQLRQAYTRKSGRVAIKPVTWTWRINREQFERYRADIRRYAQIHDNRIQGLIRSLHGAPGFRQIRDDVFRLDGYIVKQYRRRKRQPPELPPLPQPVIQRRGRQDVVYPLSFLLRRLQRGCSTWFPNR